MKPCTSPSTSISLFLASALLVSLVACGGGESGGASGGADLKNGEKIFSQTCATCHGKDAMGLPNLGKGLHDNAFVRFTKDDKLIEFLKTGRPASDPLNTTGVDMPPKGGNPAMTEKDLADVAAYIRTFE
ncbi:MAG: cytochrome c [Thermoanaerobaculia bacterium]|nr:cytochrome c [Thermoanaerobaculia bacterium]